MHRHLKNIAHVFLELRNDKELTTGEKSHAVDTIETLLIYLQVNLDEEGTEEQYKNDVLKAIGWHDQELEGKL